MRARRRASKARTQTCAHLRRRRCVTAGEQRKTVRLVAAQSDSENSRNGCEAWTSNPGSTCYLNACLTTAAALQPLHAVLFRPPRQHNCISSNGCLLCALHTFGSVFLTSSSDLASRIAETRAAVVGLWQRIFPRFVNSREHDAHDAWTSLLQLALQNLRADTSNTRYGRRSSTQCCGKHRKLSSKQ